MNFDLSHITAAGTALTAAKELGRAMLGVRDFNKMAPEIAHLNDLLLKAQDGLFAHNAQLMALQQEHFEATQKLRKLEEALAERGRYTLFELVPGFFVYRVNLVPQLGGAGDPRGAEPQHYVCQTCFDKGNKSVLKFSETLVRCSLCSDGRRLGEGGSGRSMLSRGVD